MRYFQITLFVLAGAAFLTATCFIGTEVGESLWKAGLAALLFDIVSLQLWPSRRPAVHPPGH